MRSYDWVSCDKSEEVVAMQVTSTTFNTNYFDFRALNLQGSRFGQLSIQPINVSTQIVTSYSKIQARTKC